MTEPTDDRPTRHPRVRSGSVGDAGLVSQTSLRWRAQPRTESRQKSRDTCSAEKWSRHRRWRSRMGERAAEKSHWSDGDAEPMLRPACRILEGPTA